MLHGPFAKDARVWVSLREATSVSVWFTLTLSSPVVPNGYTTAPECPNVKKNKNGGLDQYGFEHFVV